MTNLNSLQDNSKFFSFSFKNNPVRAIVKNGDPWFCFKDICDVLGIKNASDTRKSVDQRGIATSYTPTKSGEQELLFINEPNLYRVIFKSRKNEALIFQDWVFEEVLPSIRKTGSYSANTNHTTNQEIHHHYQAEISQLKNKVNLAYQTLNELNHLFARQAGAVPRPTPLLDALEHAQNGKQKNLPKFVA